MLLSAYPLKTRGFTVNVAEKTLSAEASDLGLPPGFRFHRIYDDACDIGLTFQSHRTDRTVTWYLAESETVETDGEEVQWTLRPIAEHVRRDPGLAEWTMIIFND